MRLTDALVLIPLTLAMIVLGLFPQPVINACTKFANELWITQLLK